MFVVNHQWQGGLQNVINNMRMILHIIQMPKSFGMVSGYTHVFSCRYSLKSKCHPWSNMFCLLLHFFCSAVVRNSTTFSLESRKHHFCSVYLGKDSMQDWMLRSPQLKRTLLGNEYNWIWWGQSLRQANIPASHKGVCLFYNSQMNVYISLMLEKKKN